MKDEHMSATSIRYLKDTGQCLACSKHSVNITSLSLTPFVNAGKNGMLGKNSVASFFYFFFFKQQRLYTSQYFASRFVCGKE